MSGKKTLRQLSPAVLRACGTQQGREILQKSEARWETLCRENGGDSKALRKHTFEVAYPMIALHQSLQEAGISKEESAKLLYEAMAERAEPGAASMRKLLKCPGLYRAMPVCWKLVTRMTYGTAAGFRFHFYDVGKKRVKFDMTRCPYWDTFQRYDCPEIAPALCHTDDVNNEHAHPRLLWNRTKTLAGGGDCCDFDLIVK